MLSHESPLHIAFLSDPGGGADTYVRQMARSLAARGHRVTIVYLCGPDRAPADAWPGEATHVELAPVSNLHYYVGRLRRLAPEPVRRFLPNDTMVRVVESTLALGRAVRRINRRARIDLIELLEETAFPTLLKGFPPYAVKLHSSDATWRLFCGEGLRPIDQRRMGLEAALLRRARLVTSPSAALADYIARVCRVRRERIGVLPYPFDLDVFKPNPPGDQRPDSAQSVLYVGRLVRRKGLITLARAAEAILTHSPGAVVDIVGGETAEMSAAEFLSHVPPVLHARVVFHGRVPYESLPDYYRRAAVCVVPSLWDNSPNTVYEAMGCGRPVVASRVGGIPELVTDGETGILVPPEDPAALADGVTALLDDPAMRARMSLAARARAEASFDPAEITKRTEELYRAALRMGPQWHVLV